MQPFNKVSLRSIWISCNNYAKCRSPRVTLCNALGRGVWIVNFTFSFNIQERRLYMLNSAFEYLWQEFQFWKLKCVSSVTHKSALIIMQNENLFTNTIDYMSTVRIAECKRRKKSQSLSVKLWETFSISKDS